VVTDSIPLVRKFFKARVRSIDFAGLATYAALECTKLCAGLMLGGRWEVEQSGQIDQRRGSELLPAGVRAYGSGF
jgi:hypothetical protein